MEKLVIYRAYYSEREKEAGHLPMVEDEFKNIYTALRQRVVDNKIEFIYPDSEVYKVHEMLSQRQDIRIFHFSGHASKDKLILGEEALYASGLKDLIANCDIVVLNGCSTIGQLKYLTDTNVKAIIATTVDVRDDDACEFATALYRNLANNQTLEKAYNNASHLVLRTRKRDNTTKANIYSDDNIDTHKEADRLWALYLKSYCFGKWSLNNFDHINEQNCEEYDKEIRDLNSSKIDSISQNLIYLPSFGKQRREFEEIYDRNHAVGAFLIQGAKGDAVDWLACNILYHSINFSYGNYKEPYYLSFDEKRRGEQEKKRREEFSELLKGIYTYFETKPMSKFRLDDIFKAIERILKRQAVIFKFRNALQWKPELVRDFLEKFWWKLYTRINASGHEKQTFKELVLVFIEDKVLEDEIQDRAHPLNLYAQPELEAYFSNKDAEIEDEKKVVKMNDIISLDYEKIETWLSFEQVFGGQRHISLRLHDLANSKKEKRKNYIKSCFFSKAEKLEPEVFMDKICDQFDLEISKGNRIWEFQPKITLILGDGQEDDLDIHTDFIV